MQLVIKIFLSVVIILAATAIGRKFPAASGLVGVMPLTGALVLAWMYIENSGDSQIMQKFAVGAVWGILPSTLFFIVAFICFKRHFPLPITLISSFGAWLCAAVVHQWLLK